MKRDPVIFLSKCLSGWQIITTPVSTISSAVRTEKNDQIKKSPELETVREIPLSGFPYCYRSGDSLFIQYNMFLLRHKGFHIYLCHPGTKYLHFHCNMHSHQKHFQHQYCLLLWMIRKMSLHLMYQKPLPFRHFPVLSIRHLLPAPPCHDRFCLRISQ